MSWVLTCITAVNLH